MSEVETDRPAGAMPEVTRQPHRWPVWVATTLLGIGIGTVMAHESDVTVTAGGTTLKVHPVLNSDVHTLKIQTAKSGPICAKIPSDIDLAYVMPLGLRVTTYQSAEADITAYAEIYNQQAEIKSAILLHYGEHAGGGAAVALAALGITRILLGADRERLGKVRKAARGLTISGASFVFAAPIGIGVVNKLDPGIAHTQGDPIFDDTTLEGSSLCGQQLADRAKYHGLTTTFKHDFAEHVKYFSLPDDEDVVPILLRTDAHCNLGIQELNLEMAKSYGVKVYATLGDEFSSGRYLSPPYDEEKMCVSPFYKALKRMGVDMVGVSGNHETPEAVAFMRKLGMVMLEGQTADVGGIQFFGYGDPVRSNGTGSVPHDTPEQHALNTTMGELVGKAACLDRQRRDVVLAHEYQMALAIMEEFERCGQPAANFLDGHAHIGYGPYDVNGRLITIFDTAGGADKSPKLDWLARPAVAYVPFIQKTTGQMVRLDVVTANPDGTVNIKTVLPSQALAPDPTVMPELNSMASNVSY